MGKSVVIVGPDKHLGGLSSGGLGFTDTGNKAVIGGLSREFYHRVWQHYDRAGGVEVAEAGGVRQQGPGDAGDRRRAADDVDLRAARRRAGVRGSRQGASDPRPSRRVARPRQGRRQEAGGRIASITMLSGKTLRRADVHRRHLRRRPDGGGRRRLPRRPRGAGDLRREVERRPDRRAAPSPSLRRPEGADQPLRRARRSEERRAAAHQHASRRASTAQATSACRPTATACA